MKIQSILYIEAIANKICHWFERSEFESWKSVWEYLWICLYRWAGRATAGVALDDLSCTGDQYILVCPATVLKGWKSKDNQRLKPPKNGFWFSSYNQDKYSHESQLTAAETILWQITDLIGPDSNDCYFQNCEICLTIKNIYN